MKIGELAQVTGVSTRTIRFYENSGLLAPPDRTSGGYRHYGSEVINRLLFIRRCQAAGISLADTREILGIHDGGDEPCEHVRQTLISRLKQIRQRVAELGAVEGHLVALLNHAQGDGIGHADTDFCWILESGPESDAMNNPHDADDLTHRRKELNGRFDPEPSG